MGFSSVFKSLQEIFPEVDARLLRAVAIEHPKDADHAVEVVLSEVLPYISKHSNSSSPREQQCPKDPSGEGQNVGYAEEDTKPHNSVVHLPVQRSVSGGDNEVYMAEPMSSEDSTDSTSQNGTCNEFVVFDEDDKSISSGKIEMNGDAGLDHVANVDQHRVSTDSESIAHRDNQVFMAEPKSSEDSADANLTSDANNTVSTSQNSICNRFVVFDEDDKSISSGKVEMNGDDGLDHVPNVDQHRVSVDSESIAHIPVEKTQEVNIECGTEEIEDVNATISVLEDENATKLHNPNLEDFDQQLDTQSIISDREKGSENVVVKYEDDSALVSRSGRICRVESLEGIIEDAKYSKRTLVSAKESIVNMMKEVELHEKAAEEAKEEAAKGGYEILMKVEELKEMLVHAKEANDMHAGEVYGEKAILATEVRELQSRVLGLSRERDISLAILNDMRETLESRLCSAQEVMRAALLEKREKEAYAQNALAEQEAIMEKVVQESKMLQREAEENSKVYCLQLQESLIDRGRVVDMLQGEMSVICKDVRLLKEKFENHTPLSLASSTSSLESVVSDLDIELSSSKMLNKTSPTTSITDGQSPKSYTTSIINAEAPKPVHDRPKYAHKALLDDEWYLFDGFEDFVSGMV